MVLEQVDIDRQKKKNWPSHLIKNEIKMDLMWYVKP